MIIKLPIYDIVLVIDPETKCGTVESSISDLGDFGDSMFMDAIDAIESLILAHACAGVDIESPEYIEGIQTAVEAAANNL